MTVGEMVRLIGGCEITGSGMDREIRGGFMCDIMSRTMAEGFPGMAWITHRADMNALAIAVMKNAACIVFPAGAAPGEDIIRQAQKEKMPLVNSDMAAYELAGILYSTGIRGGKE